MGNSKICMQIQCEPCCQEMVNIKVKERMNAQFFRECFSDSVHAYPKRIYEDIKEEVQTGQYFKSKGEGLEVYSCKKPFQRTYYKQKQFLRHTFSLPKLFPNRGVILAENKFYYEGDLLNNKAHGKGKLIFYRSNQKEGRKIYEGNFVEDRIQGDGVYQEGQKVVFKGEWVNGIPYKGDLFKEGIFLQEKVKIKINNSKYLNGKYSVNCEIPGSNGIYKYEGQIIQKKLLWSKNNFCLQGKGTMVFPDGSVYEGNWENNLMHGDGKYTWLEGDRYEGKYESGLKKGKGKYIYADGYSQQGIWDDENYTLQSQSSPSVSQTLYQYSESSQ